MHGGIDKSQTGKLGTALFTTIEAGDSFSHLKDLDRTRASVTAM